MYALYTHFFISVHLTSLLCYYKPIIRLSADDNRRI